MRVRNPPMGTRFTSRIATRPALTPSQNSLAVLPWAVTAPTPVTTTRTGSLGCPMTGSSPLLGLLRRPQGQGHVLACQPAGQRHRLLHAQRSRSLLDPVQGAVRVDLLQVQRGRRRLVLQ